MKCVQWHGPLPYLLALSARQICPHPGPRWLRFTLAQRCIHERPLRACSTGALGPRKHQLGGSRIQFSCGNDRRERQALLDALTGLAKLYRQCLRSRCGAGAGGSCDFKWSTRAQKAEQKASVSASRTICCCATIRVGLTADLAGWSRVHSAAQ